jgi:AcrR family transcriptional regulator
MLCVAVHKGYAGANVAEVITEAGVSRPTFYQYFADKDDCFLAVNRDLSKTVIGRVTEAVRAEPPERAMQAVMRTLILLAEAKPERARFLVNETLAGGLQALDQRDRSIALIERIIEQARAEASPEASTPDLPTRAVLGGVCGLLAPRLRRNEHGMRKLAEEITSWIDGYCHPTKDHRWRTLEPGPALPPPRHISELVPHPPQALPPGRPSIPSAEVARNQRERLLYATAEVAARKGYKATTIADITKTASVDRRVFYANFQDKRQAFLAVHEFGFQQLMAVCASAFFSGTTWPERIWEGIHAGTHFSATYPVLTRIGYVEAYAVGGPAIQRVEDNHAAFKLFMQEGYLHSTNPPPRPVLDAIAAATSEIGYDHARRHQIRKLPCLVPHAVYLALTPFLGREAANDFIDEKLAQYQRTTDRPTVGQEANEQANDQAPQRTTGVSRMVPVDA